jgi:Protein of unknown function (DUF1579)
MKLMAMVLTAATVFSVSAASGWAADKIEGKVPEMPQPGPEHAWLQQMVGEWKATTEAQVEPGKPPIQSQGTETIRPLGGFWTVSDIKSTMMDKPFTGSMALGYDSNKKKYVGTWIDSMTGYLWNYEGSMDPAGKVLTLESEGACPMKPGKMTKFKDVIELKDKDHKSFSSLMLGEDGKWTTLMTGHSERVK